MAAWYSVVWLCHSLFSHPSWTHKTCPFCPVPSAVTGILHGGTHTGVGYSGLCLHVELLDCNVCKLQPYGVLWSALPSLYIHERPPATCQKWHVRSHLPSLVTSEFEPRFEVPRFYLIKKKKSIQTCLAKNMLVIRVILKLCTHPWFMRKCWTG